VSTITVTTNYVVGPNQTLTFTGEDPVYTLSEGTSDPTFTDQGSITDSSSQANATLAVFSDGYSSFFANSLITIAQGASLTVNATGAGSTAYGYHYGPGWDIAIQNNGTITVSAVQTAVGIY
jgi:hypothetical protein